MTVSQLITALQDEVKRDSTVAELPVTCRTYSTEFGDWYDETVDRIRHISSARTNPGPFLPVIAEVVRLS